MDIRSQKQARAPVTRWLLIWLAFVFVMLSAPTYAGTVTYVYTDAQGTPLAKADASGTIIATFDYAPYGSQALGTPPSGPGYTGHVNDPDTGLVYMQARYYDPVVGRFLSVDPVGPSPGNLFHFNRYDYADNNPIGNIDPDGRSVLTKLIKLAINGGNVAQTVAGVVSDAKTVMNPNASPLERAGAAISIASEAAPVSVADAKDVFKGVKAASEKLGGAYSKLKRGPGLERHRIPSVKSGASKSFGSAIVMEKADHQKTGSWGSSRESGEFRSQEKQLMDNGDFQGAQNMGIKDIQEKFGTQYD